MGIILQGTDDFQYKLSSADPPTALEELSRASQSGSLFFVVDSYEVTFADGETKSVYLESLESLLGLDEDPECGFYESDSRDTDPADILASLWKGEKEHAEGLAEHFEERAPVSIEVYANVLVRFNDDDWELLLAYVNEHLPEEAPLTMDEVASFDVGTLVRFTPGKDEPQRADGTGVMMYFHETSPDDGLPSLGFCVLVHAVTHDLEDMDVEEEPLYHEVLWPAEVGAARDTAEEEEEEGEEDEEEE